MGLPLFRAPVEPEVPAQNTTEKNAARARSSIRRHRSAREIGSRRRTDVWREAPSPTEPSRIPPETLLPLDQALADAVHRFHGDEHPQSTSELDSGMPGFRRNIPLSSLPPLERQSSLHITEPQPFPHLSDSRRASLLRVYASRQSLRRLGRDNQAPGNASAARPAASAPSPPPEVLIAPRSFQGLLPRPNRPSSGANNPWAIEEHPSASEELPPFRRWGNSAAWQMAQRRRNARSDPAFTDGLGDRNRSPSWEGDGAWDTLLTTLTPDPQPPSASSSFASASASASASTSATTNAPSSATPLTSFDDDPTIENACDIVEDIVGNFSDVSDTEAEIDDEIYDQNHRTYADVVSSRRRRLARRGGTDVPESLGGLQRIMRRLADREDIPDEWWAEVGLSRSLRREEIV